ncbi:MAG TPA: FAD-dependent monooxygenase [Polyangiaceae bacterium]|jgi:2-polyprenyl-6-methoxyphenol hydroxylase-like FAD-dependent oxidoreductase|nr:FAD-dependent monooxygenase [Polyangiaceae bacterium]
MKEPQVLIVGAGPTGLVLALWLTRLGVAVRIVDRATGPGQTSRALAVQARTLEFYSQVGLAEAVVADGVRAVAANLWARGKKEAHLQFGELGKGLSPFPYALVYPQDRHERLLVERLERLGVRVERPVELAGFATDGGRIRAKLQAPGAAASECEVDYLAGCDGARSAVREGLHIGFPGGTYAHLFYVADVEASGPQMNGELHVAFDGDDFMIAFPIDAEHKRTRLVGTVRGAPGGGSGGEPKVEWSDVSPSIMRHIGLTIGNVNWFSTYRVHHRVASAFRAGRVFLLGDSAHIHSPVGGQGMNTGIGDAVNLAWKLAAVLKAEATDTILDSYEKERIPFAQRLVHTTDRAFEIVTRQGPLADRVRVDVVPPLMSALFRSGLARRFFFQTISQIRVNYRGSPLSDGAAGRVRGGDRLPWVPFERHRDNFEPLASLAWQAHVYGEPDGELRKACETRHLPLHAWPWSDACSRAGLARGALYLVRPDGYVGLAAPEGTATERLARYLASRALRLA